MKSKKSFRGTRWLTLKNLMASPEIKAIGLNEIDVVRWAKQNKISVRLKDSKKVYDITEVVGFALALSNGWVLAQEEKEQDE